MTSVAMLGTLVGLPVGLPLDVPVDPDAPEAQQWVIDELSKPEYQAAQPTLFDRIAQAIADWFASLQLGGVQGPPALAIGLVIVAVAVAIVVAFLVFGRPRLNRRAAMTGSLFGADDERTADALRASAEDAAARGDFSTAVIDLFRSIARGLAERTIVTTSPGTTARDFAARSGLAFPAHAERLAAASVDFDAVRYLGRTGTREQFEQLRSLEADLRSSRPTLAPRSAELQGA